LSLYKISFTHKFKIERAFPGKENRYGVHKGAITCVDIELYHGRVASGGEDGNVKFHLIQDFPKHESEIQISTSSVTIDAVRFASPCVVFTAQGTSIDVWDLRTDMRRSVNTLRPVPKETIKQFFHEDCRFWDIDVHPTQPTMCIAGDNLGCFSVWDTRMYSSSKPLFPYFHSGAHHDNVWKVSFVPLMPSVALSCGDDGQLFSWAINNFNVPSKSLNSDENVRKWTENAEGLHDFDFCGTTIVVATESESLLFMYDVLEEMASSM